MPLITDQARRIFPGTGGAGPDSVEGFDVIENLGEPLFEEGPGAETNDPQSQGLIDIGSKLLQAVFQTKQGFQTKKKTVLDELEPVEKKDLASLSADRKSELLVEQVLNYEEGSSAHIKAIRKLIRAGADPNHVSNPRWTIHNALEVSLFNSKNPTKLLKVLVNEGDLDIDAPGGPLKRTVFAMAVSHEHSAEAFRFLLSKKPVLRSEGNTAMHCAFETKFDGHHVDIALELLEYAQANGYEIDPKDQNGFTPIQDTPKPRLFEALVQAGADTEIRNDSLETLLHLAVKSGDRELLRKVLELQTININAPDLQGHTALNLAAKQGETEMVAMLLEAGANPDGYRASASELVINPTNNEAVAAADMTPVMMALSWVHKDIAMMLIEAGADLSIRTAKGTLAINLAVRQELGEDICKEILRRCPEVYSPGADPKTNPLVAACQKDNYEVIELIRAELAKSDIPPKELEAIAKLAWKANALRTVGSTASLEGTSDQGNVDILSFRGLVKSLPGNKTYPKQASKPGRKAAQIIKSPDTLAFMEVVRKARLIDRALRSEESVLKNRDQLVFNGLIGNAHGNNWVKLAQRLGEFSDGEFRSVADTVKDIAKHLVLSRFVFEGGRSLEAVVSHDGILEVLDDFEPIVAAKIFEGRSIDQVIKLSRMWHEEMHYVIERIREISEEGQWHKAFEPYQITRGSLKGYSVTCLSTAGELKAESGSMNNCVSSYTSQCLSGSMQIAAVRDPSGKSISNFEIKIVDLETAGASSELVVKIPDSDRALIISEHLGEGNTDAPQAALAAVQALKQAIEQSKITTEAEKQGSIHGKGSGSSQAYQTIGYEAVRRDNAADKFRKITEKRFKFIGRVEGMLDRAISSQNPKQLQSSVALVKEGFGPLFLDFFRSIDDFKFFALRGKNQEGSKDTLAKQVKWLRVGFEEKLGRKSESPEDLARRMKLFIGDLRDFESWFMSQTDFNLAAGEKGESRARVRSFSTFSELAFCNYAFACFQADPKLKIGKGNQTHKLVEDDFSAEAIIRSSKTAKDSLKMLDE